MLKTPLDWEPYRKHHPLYDDIGNRCNGYFWFPARRMVVLVSNGGDWEHASVSIVDRCPTWDEMDEVKRRLWGPSDVVMQLHVAADQHVNNHPYCLHLWRPLDRVIPLPPIHYVGLRAAATEATKGQS